MKFEGIYTPAITPLGPDRQIDRKGFAAVLESLIEAKVHGIIVGGSTGEYYAQSAQERFELAAYAKDVIGTRLALVIGTGATRTEDSVEYAKAAKEIGADAILVSSPPYALPTEKENAIHALTIDRAANLPIMLYNYPARMGITMREDYFSRVGRSKTSWQSRKAPAKWPTSISWRASFRISAFPVAGTTRPWNSLPGVPKAGSAPAPTSCRANMSPSTKPASLKRISTRAARS